MSFVKGHKTDLHPNTVSNYLKSCVQIVYKPFGKTLPMGINSLGQGYVCFLGKFQGC